MPTRAAIVLLVVLNLGAALWWWLHAPPAPQLPPAPPPGAARLHLAGDSVAAGSAATLQHPAVPASVPVEPAPTVQAAPQQATPSPASVATQAASTATNEQALLPRDSTAATGADACEGGAGPAVGWRVYLPRLPTVEAAQATAARIGEAGFSDYLVVRDGADANTIALGRYGSEAAARRRSASLRAAGFPARCARIPPATPA